MSNFSELNQDLNLNGIDSYSVYKDSSFSYNPSFNKSQNLNNYKSDKYYCNGKAGLASKMSNIQETKVSKEFFSKENLKRIQKKIRREIYNRTDGKYVLEVDQDELDLQIVMQKILDEYTLNRDDKIVRQVKKLNEYTIDYIVPDMITNIKQFYGYMKEINNPIKPMDRPINLNNAGSNPLPSITTIWE